MDMFEYLKKKNMLKKQNKERCHRSTFNLSDARLTWANSRYDLSAMLVQHTIHPQTIPGPTAGSIHHYTIDIIHHRNHSIPYHGQTIPSPAGRALPYRHSDFQGNYHFPFLTQAVCSSGKVPRKQRLGKFVMPNEIVCLWLFFFFFGSFKLLPDGTNVAIASINMIVCVSFY